jgi:hypothetical protein
MSAFRFVCAAAACLATVGFAPKARAADDGLSCGRRLVTLGDPQALVVERCGEPETRTTRQEVRIVRGRPVYVTVDDWTYRLGGRRFVRRALFENGRLVSVEALSR